MTDRSKFTRATATGNMQSLVTNYNANLDTLEQELENTLSRKDEVLPNSMEDALDMNSNRIINMADGVEDSDAITLRQLEDSLALYKLNPVDSIDFNTDSTAEGAEARLVWNDVDGTLDLGLKGGNVTLQIGQEQLLRVVNKTSDDLLEADYQCVKISGAQGQRPKVALALADNDLNSTDTVGLVTENITKNSEGFITTSGMVRKINTTGSLQGETWADGDVLYVSGTVAGQVTNIKPVAPIHTVVVGFVIHAHATQGSIFVKVDNGYELEELHNVSTATRVTGDLLKYNSVTGLWENSPIANNSDKIDGYHVAVDEAGTDPNTIYFRTTGGTLAVDWTDVSNTPTTLAGYGITDGLNSSLKGAIDGLAELDGTGKVPASQLPSYVDDVREYASFAALPATGEQEIIYVTLDDNKVWRWSGATYIEISPTAGNADTATKLAVARDIAMTGDVAWTVNFDGSANVSAAGTLSNTGVSAGTYNNSATEATPFTVDAKGRITSTGTPVVLNPLNSDKVDGYHIQVDGAGTAPDTIYFKTTGGEISVDWDNVTGTPTTLGGYGITDAYTKTESDTTFLGINDTAVNSDKVDGYHVQVDGTGTDPNTIYFKTTGGSIGVDWSDVANTPTTVAGYGITDALTVNLTDEQDWEFIQRDGGEWINKTAEEAGVQTFHGFVFPYQATLSYVGSTRTLTITPTGASYDVWIQGKKYVKTGVQTFTHSADAGDHFIYYDATGNLVESASPWDFKNVSPVAFVFYTPSINDGYALFELHTYKRNPEWHESQHFAIGTFVRSGLVMSGYTLNTATDAANTPLISSGVLVDEDIEYATSQINDGGPYTIVRRSGASDYVWTTTNSFPFLYSTNRINYNQNVGGNWQLTEATSGKFVNYYVYATTALDANKRVYIVPSQVQFDTLSDASAESTGNLDIGTFSLTEFTPLYKIVFQVNVGYATTGQVRIAAVERITGSKGSVNISLLGAVHNALSGRSDADAHPISAITDLQSTLDGKVSLTGDQTVAGTKTFSGTNTIVNGSLGVGTASPAYKLDVSATAQNEVARFTGASNGYLDFTNGTGTFRIQTLSNIPHIGSYTNHNLNLITNNAVKATIDTAGNVGIGTASPSFRLTTNYTAPATFTNAVGDFTQMWQAGGTNALGVAVSTGDAYARFVVNNGYKFAWNSASTDLMTLSEGGTLAVAGTVDSSSFRDNANTAYYLDPANTGTALAVAGNVGVGTTSPALKLSVLSGVNTNDTTTPTVMIGSDRDDYYASINSVRGSASTYLGLSFSTSNNAAPAERMRIDSAGNVGIGITPSAWGTSGYMTFKDGGGITAAGPSMDLGANAYFNGGWKYASNGTASVYAQASGTHSWYSATSGTANGAISFSNVMTLYSNGALEIPSALYASIFYDANNTAYYVNPADTSISMTVAGNVGIGVTPSAWGNFKAIQINTGGNGALAAPYLQLTSNAYYNGSNWVYTETGEATRMDTRPAGNAGFAWHVATSGTAGNAISFTQAMTLNNSGNLGIGTTSPSAKLEVNGNARLSNGSGFTTANSIIRQIESVAGAENQFTIGSVSFLTGAFSDNGQIAFSTNAGSGNTERMRIDSAGNVGIGTTVTSYNKLNIGDDGSSGGTVGLSFTTGQTERAEITMSGDSGLMNITSGYAGYGGKIAFNANGGTRMYIDTTGYVGIGTSSPAYKLDVDGEVRFRGNSIYFGTDTLTSIDADGGVFDVRTGVLSPLSEKQMLFDQSGDLTISRDMYALDFYHNVAGFNYYMKLGNTGTSINTAGGITSGGNLITKVNATAPTLSANSTMSFELTSDTSLKIVVRGSDGVTRSTTLTLA